MYVLFMNFVKKSKLLTKIRNKDSNENQINN